MKKLNADEFASLPLKGKGRSSIVFNSIINLKEGEGLLIEQKDWNRKAAPSTLIRYIEKKYKMKFSFGTLENGSGWAVQRVNEIKRDNKITVKPVAKVKSESSDRLTLKSELTLFYLGRISFNKIERIEDTLKAAIINYWKEDKQLVEELFHEVIEGLREQGHIVIENDKTYIPLKRA